MSGNTNDPWKNNGQNTWQGSTNQGVHEAQTGQSASGQQAGESWTSYTTHLGAYNTAKGN